MHLSSSTCQIAHRILRNRRSLTVCALVAACVMFAGCAQLQYSSSPEGLPPPEPTSPAAASSAPRVAPGAVDTAVTWRQRGRISLYGNTLAGKPTASGDTFDPERLTMAHRTLPFGTLVRVTNQDNQRSVEVVVNDRGPFVPGRIADLSAAAARQIGMVVDGVVDALLEVLQPSKIR